MGGTVKVLLVGGGGREHAMAWSLAKSPRIEKLFIAPGNAGTAMLGENVAIPAEDVARLVAFAQDNALDLVVVGPEAPLAAGLVDALAAVNIRAFGPTQAAAQLEASKAFSKAFMQSNGIPTAAYGAFAEYDSAVAYVQSVTHPVVVKADGLAAGKGVIVCDDSAQALDALNLILRDQVFGSAGGTVVIEERLIGREASVLAFCDGKNAALMPAMRDHKRVFDHDEGPNTGGMGAFGPVDDLSADALETIRRTVIQPALDGMRERGTPYVGVLYAGLMLTADGVKTLEFNCRFGDPETQAILPLLDSDLLEILLACVEGRLDESLVRWKSGACATVVAASAGYPGDYPKGLPISGVNDVENSIVFYAGVVEKEGQLVTSGGRVLAVSAIGATLDDALKTAYADLARISFDGMHYRRDIGQINRDEPMSKDAYSQAGVDIAAGTRATQLMKAAVHSTYNAAVLSQTGSFGGLFALDGVRDRVRPVLVASTDGVGTKTMVAAKMNRWDSIGQDLVNHCVNDILVQGATPLFFLDYVASSKLNPEQIAAVVGGCATACREVGAVLLGGETAEMPGVYQPGELDLAGTIVGVVDFERIIDGKHIGAGDVVLALPSTGLHTNGYSLARKVLEPINWSQPHSTLKESVGEALLKVHRCYLPEVKALWKAGIDIRGMAHITGGGVIDNLPRVFPDGLGAEIWRGTWEILPIFKLIQSLGAIPDNEMFHAFNMGLGMLLVVAPAQAESAMQTVPELRRVGEIRAGVEGVSILD